eukprot:TRINITY_DN9770_c0_g2_i1.p1 TRINITY_DN9770_c0_g2~~TRINITY_DN9770_c0_g2_i1.p1  ORF type:complete len:607 (+),score=116.10 TRINITY_DN9770_c0_g2_i1:211-2031(+)
MKIHFRLNIAAGFQLGTLAVASCATFAAIKFIAVRFRRMNGVTFPDLPGAEALASFYHQGPSGRSFTPELRSILEVVAITGSYWHDWHHLKVLLAFRLDQVLNEYNARRVAVEVGPPRPLKSGETFAELREQLQQALESFSNGAPFTVQRLCELLLHPNATYPCLDKLALALEKLLVVTSSIPPSRSRYPSLPLPADQLEALARPARRTAVPVAANGEGPSTAAESHMPPSQRDAQSAPSNVPLSDGPSEATPMNIDGKQGFPPPPFPSLPPPPPPRPYHPPPARPPLHPPPHHEDNSADGDTSEAMAVDAGPSSPPREARNQESIGERTDDAVASISPPRLRHNHEGKTEPHHAEPSSHKPGPPSEEPSSHLSPTLVFPSLLSDQQPISPSRGRPPPVTTADIGPQPRTVVEQLPPGIPADESPGIAAVLSGEIGQPAPPTKAEGGNLSAEDHLQLTNTAPLANGGLPGGNTDEQTISEARLSESSSLESPGSERCGDAPSDAWSPNADSPAVGSIPPKVSGESHRAETQGVPAPFSPVRPNEDSSLVGGSSPDVVTSAGVDQEASGLGVAVRTAEEGVHQDKLPRISKEDGLREEEVHTISAKG